MSNNRAGDKQDQPASRIQERKGEGRRACKHSFKNLIPPTWKKKLFLVSKCQMSESPYVRYGVTRTSFTKPSWSSQCVAFCCYRSCLLCLVRESFEYRSLCVDVQKINYQQRIRLIWRIKTIVLQELSQIKTTAYTTCKTATRLARKQPHLNHVVSEWTKELQT